MPRAGNAGPDRPRVSEPLDTVGAVIDYGRFAERLAARTDRWGLLVEFQREWGYVGAINRGFEGEGEDADGDEFEGEDEDDEGEEEPCPVVPASLTEWYALPQNSFMHAATLYWTHPHMPPTRWPATEDLAEIGLPAERLEPVPGRSGVFMAEYEYCWTWSYLEREAALDPDPPVYLADTERHGRELERVLIGERRHARYQAARSISEWVLAFAVTAIPFNIAQVANGPDELRPGQIDHALVAGLAAWEGAGLSAQERDRVRETFPELGLLPWIGFGCYELRGGPDVVMMLRTELPDVPDEGGEYDLLIAGRSAEALELALDRVGLRDAQRTTAEVGVRPEG